MIEKRTFYITLLYLVLFVALFLFLVLCFGLAFYHKQTVDILLQVRNYTIITLVIVVALFIVKLFVKYRHIYILQREERDTARAIRTKEEQQARVYEMEAYHKEQQAEFVKTDMYVKQQELYMQRSRFAMDIEVARARLLMEQQQAALLRVNVNESVYAIQPGNELKQLVQGQSPAARIAQRGNNEPVQSPALPYAPTFQQMQGLIASQDHLVLAYTRMAPVYGTLEDHLLSMLFTGRPKTGKSTAILYYAAMFLKVGVLPVILDPQGSLQELEGILPYRNSMQSIHEFVPLLYTEFQEREELWRKGRMLKPYSIVVIIDELPMIAAWEETNTGRDDLTVLGMIKKIILELRKLHVYVIAAGQGFPATVLPTLSRENTSSRLIFPTSERYAKMAGLSDKHIKTLLPQLNAVERGTGILDVSCMSEPILIDIPFTTVHDVVQQIGNNTSYHELIKKFEDAPFVDSIPVYSLPAIQGRSKKPTHEEYERIIIEHYQQGITTIRKIAESSGISYNILRPIYNELKKRGKLITPQEQS